MRLPLALLALAALLAAGCVQAPGVAPAADAPAPGTPAAVAAKLQGLLADVPCEATVVDDATSDNLLPLSLTVFDGTMHAELDHLGHLLLSARYQTGGFDVLDATDPTGVTHVATYEGEETTALDVKWMPAGDAVVVGNSDGVQLVDARDPVRPTLASKWRFEDVGHEGTAHMVDTHRIAGKEYVFLATGADAGVPVLVREGWNLTYVTTILHPVLTGGPIGPHDMTVLDDETLGEPILYVANGFEGWLAWDVSDPAAPVHLGGMPNADPAQGYLHTIQAEKVGDRRLVATVSEVGVNAVKVWDATDLARPVLLAEWFADATRPTLPNHNLQLLDGLLYVAHYGKGVYVFDLTTLGATPLLGTLDLRPVAHFAPPHPDPAQVDATAFVNVWDIVLKDGILYVSDVNEGVHALGFGCLDAGDPAQTSRG